jgi:hypothetical protein
MDIKTIKSAILLCRDAGVTSFLWGHRGLGKSSLHEQVANTQHWGYINLRCSQMEASDLRGLPDKENGMTVYRHPAELPHGHDVDLVCPSCYGEHSLDERKQVWQSYSDEDFEDGVVPEELITQYRLKPGEHCKGLLFLDELNRAEDDVLQAGFELVLDYKVGSYRVPVGWSVHCAGNYMEGYMVNNFSDPAFLDRFCHLNLTNSEEYYKAWGEYMSRFGMSAKILQFVGFNLKHLLGDVKGERGFSVQPSPRSWEFVARVEEVCREKTIRPGVKLAVIGGVIGEALALQYDQFTCEVTPRDVMNQGMTGNVKTKVKNLHRNALVGLIWGLAAATKQAAKNKTMMTNVVDFMEFLAKDKERDLAVSLGRALCGTETEELAGAMLSNPNLASLATRWKARNNRGGDGPSWIRMINERGELQELMSKVSYGMAVGK